MQARRLQAAAEAPTCVACTTRLQHIFVQPVGVLAQKQVHVLAGEAGQGDGHLQGAPTAGAQRVGGVPLGWGALQASQDALSCLLAGKHSAAVGSICQQRARVPWPLCRPGKAHMGCGSEAGGVERVGMFPPPRLHQNLQAAAPPGERRPPPPLPLPAARWWRRRWRRRWSRAPGSVLQAGRGGAGRRGEADGAAGMVARQGQGCASRGNHAAQSQAHVSWAVGHPVKRLCQPLATHPAPA